jgi:hypothetical protein
LAVLVLAVASLAIARPAGAEPAPQPRQVEVTIAGGQQEAQDLQNVLSELLGRLGVTATYTQSEQIEISAALASRGQAGAVVARVWMDLRAPSSAMVYIAGEAGDRVLVRRVRRQGRGDEVAREELAHIVESTVDALLSGGRIGVAAEIPQEPFVMITPQAAPRSEPPRVRGFGLSLGYEAQEWSAHGDPVHGPFVSLGFFSVRDQLRLGIRLSGQMRFPSEIEPHPVGMRLDHGALRLVPEIEVGLGWAWALRGGVGAGIDLTYLQPVVSGGDAVEGDAPRWTVTPIARALVGIGYYPAPGRSFALIFAGDVDLIGTRYFVDRPGGSEDVFRPWRVRPTVGLAFGLDLFAP